MKIRNHTKKINLAFMLFAITLVLVLGQMETSKKRENATGNTISDEAQFP
jgi:hypothetical protein